MKKTTAIILLATTISSTSFGQNNVGINVNQPSEALTVDRGILLDNNNQNTGSNLVNGLRFGNAANVGQLAGISSNRSGNGGSYGLDFYAGGIKAMSISSSGSVGINTAPTGYYFEVGGTVRGTTVRSAGSVIAEGGNVQASESVLANNSITATLGNITASSGDIVATAGELKAGGRGVVMSNNATRQRIAIGTATLGVTNLGVGSSATGTLSYSAFSATPTAYVGNVLVENGDYYKAMLVLENVTTTSLTVRVVNVSSAPITFSGASWKILIIGPY